MTTKLGNGLSGFHSLLRRWLIGFHGAPISLLGTFGATAWLLLRAGYHAR